MSPSFHKPFTAVLLAGGQSRRMGRDKAGLEIEGVPLWQRQLATLRATEPAELLISGRIDGPYAGSGIKILPDETAGLGPLGGIATALRQMKTDLLLVLAIDLPDMTPEFLLRLTSRDSGIVPESEDHLEPLAATYPRTCFPVAESTLHSADHSMHAFVRSALGLGLLATFPAAAAERFLFRNLNTPSDLTSGDE